MQSVIVLALTVLLIPPTVQSMCSHLLGTEFLQQVNIPDKPVYGGNLSICREISSTEGSCCTQEIETIMLNTIKQELAIVYQDRIVVLKQLFSHQYQLFDNQYRQVIETSSKQLHAMFIRTYGPFYQSHTQIFNNLFADLQEFYSDTKFMSLKPILDRFFFDLFRTLLLILNPTDEIKENNFDCLRSSFALQPFGDIPLKMVRQLERSLGAARTLTDALKSSTDILQNILQYEPSVECQLKATQMKHCAKCLPRNARTYVINELAKSCQIHCYNVLNNCFADYIVIEKTWHQFIEALTKLATRLRGPYNVMAVVIPLAVQISESIMVFQEKAPTISARVLRKCVQKDSDPSMKHEIVPFKAPLEPLPDFTDTLTDAHSQLLTSFIAKIQETRDFWGIGPRLTCFNSTWAASDDSAFCWNDTKLVNNLKDADKLVLSDGYESNFTTTVFLIERLKLLMLSNRLLESFEGRRMNNESIDSDVEGSGFPYISVDDEDGDEFEDGGSGLDENQPAIVIDIAGSHRDISEPSATDKSDLQSTTTVVPELKVTQPKVNVTVAKISTRQKPSIFISLIVLVIIHAS